MTTPLKALRPWRALLGALVLVVVLGSIDARMKTPPAGAGREGFCPGSARWTAAAADFGWVCKALEQSDAGARVADELSGQLAACRLAVRKTTGIRPTALRWRVWMGHRLLASVSDEGVGVCVRPGLLMRVASAAHRLVAQRDDPDGIRTYAGMFYAWREGFLIFSPSREYVAASLASEPLKLAHAPAGDALRVQWHGERPWLLRLLPRDGWPVSGWMTGTIARRTTPLSLPEAWPDPPIMSVTASRCSGLAAVLSTTRAALGHILTEAFGENPHAIDLNGAARLLDVIAGPWSLDPLPDGWDTSVDECSLALLGLDTAETIPVPELALVMRCAEPVAGDHPLTPWVSGDTAIDYEWDARPGVLAPWVGEKLTLCLGRSGNDWLTGSQEPVMAALNGRLNEAPPVAADAAVRVDWASLAECVEDLLRTAAELELVPRMNTADVEKMVLPFVRAVGVLGHLKIEAKDEGDRLAFEGLLARQDPSAPDGERP
ncbi:MAG: hypothetical protein GWP08_02325 [Nitrospiraceae bacterium]|nr:hypothetical protein [Nitrospiraceae bacterium]